MTAQPDALHSSPAAPARSARRCVARSRRRDAPSRSPISTAKAPRCSPRRSAGSACRSTSPTPIRSTARSTRCATGSAPITVLVSCAGWDLMRPFVETDELFQSRVLEINLGGPIRVVRAVLPDMIEAEYGRIVLVSSDAGRVGSSGEAIYAAAKGGLIALAKSIAREVVRHGITANCVCPGPDRHTAVPRPRRGDRRRRPHHPRRSTRAIPMRRLGRPDDVAPADRVPRLGRSRLHHRADAVGERRPHDELTDRRSPSAEAAHAMRPATPSPAASRGSPRGGVRARSPRTRRSGSA